MSDPRPAPDANGGALSKPAFLGGLLGFVAAIALSVTGMSHARTVRGAAELKFWIVVLLVAAAAATVLVALARTRCQSRGGEALRRSAVAVGWVALVLFLWETIFVGAGLPGAPSALLGGV
jgi:phosphoglycerol transferase MdoB-like AlkP superfamily enzyme